MISIGYCAFRAGAERIESLVSALARGGLARSYGPGKWTGNQILAHLADAELAIGFRLRQALAEDNYKIQAFDQERWAKRYGALIRSLKPEDLARPALHPEKGPESVEIIIKLLAGHDLNHLAQLDTIASA